MAGLLEFLRAMPPARFLLLALVENAGLVALGAIGGHWAIRLPGAHRLTPDPGPVSRQELALVAVATLLNTAVTAAGWWLWRAGVIVLPVGFGPAVVVELVVLVLIMDAVMYAGHTLVHVRRVFPLVHRVHHVFSDARPITLFALHPVEVIGFGGIWLAVLAVHPFSIWSLGGYAVLNLGFGILGHLGVEPLPVRVRRGVLFRWVATPTMHAGHHARPRYNLGFYTTVWDRLFGTLDPEYDLRRSAVLPPPYVTPSAPVG